MKENIGRFGMVKNRRLFTFIKNNFELISWSVALCYLAFSNPDAPHYTLCAFKLVGFDHCPGCGIGHAISYAFKGEIKASFASHPLGLFAVAVILSRIYILSKSITKKRTHSDE
ncbi:DUF2752 domain-containing protein [Flammeovirgaceae bacterium SG7u.111]|nr:DUF2752 domain-containing protein [Flammeovirgaceae bacterium SG7u.132]WPO36702.1 DUF2752 domain-containing protein [Flammeovirgaceae bacterium SG7u.111]